ncbi:MAG: hypothetical protein ACRDZQ_04530 [Acidimicrobiales bacterium]
MIRATCPSCGDVELGTAEVRALVCETTGRASYTFRCPECRLATTAPVGAHVVDVLASAGVPVSRWRLPAELGEARPGPAITDGDVAAWSSQLAEPGWLEDAVGALAARSGPARARKDGRARYHRDPWGT